MTVRAARAWWCAALTGLVGVGIGAALAAPDSPEVSSVARVLALVAGSTVLGFAVLAQWEHPHIDARALWARTSLTAATWTVAELLVAVLAAADTQGTGIGNLTVGTFVDFLTTVSVGQVAVATLVCSVAVTVLAALAARSEQDWSPVVVMVLAGFGLLTRPVTGHMSQQNLGPILDAVHVLAAATWLGVLVALVASLRTRRGWADLLPRYSRIALWCITAVVITGSVNAAVRIGTWSALVDTGYGRIVLAKVAAALVLFAGGWWLRRTWVSTISAHRTEEEASARRAVIETAIMGVAFGLAAALATAP